MAKATFYFSHDYNCRNDEKIKRLIRKHGMVGYGIFWSIVEDLYNNDNSLKLDYDGLSYDYRIDSEIVKSIVTEFDLFIIEDNTFYSQSISFRLSKMNEKSKIGKDNAEKRWGKTSLRKESDGCTFYIVEMSYRDESFIKCGITSEGISRRFSGKTHPYIYSILFSKNTNTEEGLSLEREFNGRFKKYTPINKISGYLECFCISEKSVISVFAMQCDCKPNAIKEIKVNEINDNKEPPITSLSIQSDKRNANHAYSDENFRALCFQKGIKEKEKLFEILSGFLLHRAGNNFSESNSRDFRQHFMNWIGKSGHLHIQTKIANEQQQSHVPKADKAAIEAKYGRRNKDIPTG